MLDGHPLTDTTTPASTFKTSSKSRFDYSRIPTALQYLLDPENNTDDDNMEDIKSIRLKAKRRRRRLAQELIALDKQRKEDQKALLKATSRTDTLRRDYNDQRPIGKVKFNGRETHVCCGMISARKPRAAITGLTC